MTAVLGRRHLRVRVLEALELAVKQFRPREELWPLRVPREPVLLAPLVRRAIPGDPHLFDVSTLRARTLLHFQWEDGSVWDAWMAVLPSGFKLYCDTNGDETRLLASGGRNEGLESDRAFLELLAESAGSHFGIEMSGGAPGHVRSFLDDREFLVTLFVNLFETTGEEESVRAQLTASEQRTVDAGGMDFRADVERWLDRALRQAPAR